MNYLDAFRDPAVARALEQELRQLAQAIPEGRTLRVMEVCGSHTMAVARYGIRRVLPPRLDLLSGPGCPVCVTDAGYIDAALELSRRGARLATFGDMLHVPGSTGNLAEIRSAGAPVQVCYSPEEALQMAAGHPGNEVVFLAIGFETTVAPVVSLIPLAQQRGLKNLSLLTAFKVMPPALEALAGDPEIKVDGFLCPPHVSAIIGSVAYEPLVARHHRPCVIAGFEPLDILLGLRSLLRQLLAGEARVENDYARVVKPVGNPLAQAVIRKYLEPADAVWRGLGLLPGSGLSLRADYVEFDALRRFGVELVPGRPVPGCRCGDVLKGKIRARECPLFGRACTPEKPVGPCMVSAEGQCAAAFKYEHENS